MKDRLERLTETVSGHNSSIHVLKSLLEQILKSILNNVFGLHTCHRAFFEASLALSQSSSSYIIPLPLQMVEQLFVENRKAVSSGENRRPRDVYSYQNELDIFQAMLNEHP